MKKQFYQQKKTAKLLLKRKIMGYINGIQTYG